MHLCTETCSKGFRSCSVTWIVLEGVSQERFEYAQTISLSFVFGSVVGTHTIESASGILNLATLFTLPRQALIDIQEPNLESC